MRAITIWFFAFLLGAAHGLYSRYVYEFGQDYGPIVQNINGNIPLFHTVTEKFISVPEHIKVTYVRVVVDSISAPKVDYSADENKVVILFDWTQVSLSKYSIVVKGVADFN